MVVPLPQRVHRVQLFLRGVPENPVHSWGVLALIFRHSSHGKSFATKRVGEQTLEGFHLVPFALLCCLDDALLKPTHILIDCLPVDGVPVCHSVEGCTSNLFLRWFCRSCFCRHLLFLLCRITQGFSS